MKKLNSLKEIEENKIEIVKDLLNTCYHCIEGSSSPQDNFYDADSAIRVLIIINKANLMSENDWDTIIDYYDTKCDDTLMAQTNKTAINNVLRRDLSRYSYRAANVLLSENYIPLFYENDFEDTVEEELWCEKEIKKNGYSAPKCCIQIILENKRFDELSDDERIKESFAGIELGEKIRKYIDENTDSYIKNTHGEDN